MKKNAGIIILGLLAITLWIAYNWNESRNLKFKKIQQINDSKIKAYSDSTTAYVLIIDSLNTRIDSLNSIESSLVDSLIKMRESYAQKIDHINNLPIDSQLELFTKYVDSRQEGRYISNHPSKDD